MTTTPSETPCHLSRQTRDSALLHVAARHVQIFGGVSKLDIAADVVELEVEVMGDGANGISKIFIPSMMSSHARDRSADAPNPTDPGSRQRQRPQVHGLDRAHEVYLAANASSAYEHAVAPAWMHPAAEKACTTRLGGRFKPLASLFTANAVGHEVARGGDDVDPGAEDALHVLDVELQRVVDDAVRPEGHELVDVVGRDDTCLSARSTRSPTSWPTFASLYA